MLTNVLRDERFESVEASGSACVGFGNDGNDGCYSAETGENVGVEGVETVGEGVVIVRGGGVYHVERTMNVSVQMFLRTLHFCLLLHQHAITNREGTSAKVSSNLPVIKLMSRVN